MTIFINEFWNSKRISQFKIIKNIFILRFFLFICLKRNNLEGSEGQDYRHLLDQIMGFLLFRMDFVPIQTQLLVNHEWLHQVGNYNRLYHEYWCCICRKGGDGGDDHADYDNYIYLTSIFLYITQRYFAHRQDITLKRFQPQEGEVRIHPPKRVCRDVWCFSSG